ncbi:MAG: transposase, partial [Pirellulales bacterium]|nr:transposase [Pirellulales bacterium]
ETSFISTGFLMDFVLQPWKLYVAILAGWINRQQQEMIEYLRTENQVLKEKIGKKRILLTDDQRRRLAVKGKILGRKMLKEVGTLFTPDTILRWHRTLVAKKWNYSDTRRYIGRPRIRQVIVDLILRFANANPTWGYDRIQGALANVHSVRLPPRSPNLNSYLERYFSSLKSECLSKMIFFGETSLRNAARQYLEHYHSERNHQSLKNCIIEPGDEVGRSEGVIQHCERLGGLLNYYYRNAA